MACTVTLPQHVEGDGRTLCDSSACIVDHNKPGKQVGLMPHVCGCGYKVPSVEVS